MCHTIAEARNNLLTFIDYQSATEYARSLSAGKLSSVKNAECDWLSIGACKFDSALNGPSLISCQVSNCNLLIVLGGVGEWGTRPGNGRMQQIFALDTILQPNFWLFLKDMWLGQLVSL
jgi:hypothetical protein